MELKDKVVVITGGGQGLGRAMAVYLAGQGAKLALIDMSADSLNETVALCAEQGVEARAYVGNVTDEAGMSTVFDQIVSDFGRLDALVNNAGITRDGLFLKVDRESGKVTKKMSMDQWNAVLDVNLTGTFLCAREAAAHMVDAGNGGVIINIASISKAGNMGQTNYSATKAGVEAMAVTWAKELARYGVRAAAIAPGFIGTEMVMSMKPDALAKVEAMIPAKRLGKPEEIARTVAFILENDYVNGRCIEVDGALRL